MSSPSTCQSRIFLETDGKSHINVVLLSAALKCGCSTLIYHYEPERVRHVCQCITFGAHRRRAPTRRMRIEVSCHNDLAGSLVNAVAQVTQLSFVICQRMFFARRKITAVHSVGQKIHPNISFPLPAVHHHDVL